MNKYRRDIRKAYELIENAHNLMEQAEKIVIMGNDRTFKLIGDMNYKMEELLDSIKQIKIMQDVKVYAEFKKGKYVG